MTQERSQAEAAQAPVKHYLWLFNRQKMFLREKVVESSAPLTSQELSERYDQMHEALVDEVWPAKIAWIDWSSTPRSA